MPFAKPIIASEEELKFTMRRIHFEAKKAGGEVVLEHISKYPNEEIADLMVSPYIGAALEAFNRFYPNGSRSDRKAGFLAICEQIFDDNPVSHDDTEIPQ